MDGGQRFEVAVCGADPAEVAATLEWVNAATGFTGHAYVWPEPPPLSGPGGFVLLASKDAPGTALAEALGSRPGSEPLVAIGAEPCPKANPTCWLRRRPSAALLGLLLHQLLPAPPQGRSWRRKSDMIIGTSPTVTALLNQLDRLAPSPAPVLILGESGTGKELVARALHYSGPRAAKPFLAVNCAAIPETLFESELFGYQRGAFTGAVSARAGVFESAVGGTVFLDEIGELPLALQPKLLRVLERNEITRLGSSEPKPIDVRLVCATNRDLEEEVKKGRFREDLLYRIRVFPLELPALRERPEDIPALINHHLSLIAERDHHPVPALTPAALEKLLSHHWPGNVRELINVLQRAVLLADRGEIDARHLVLPSSARPAIPAYQQAKGEFEIRYFTQLLRAAAGNVSMAAKLAHKTRKEIYDALKRHQIDPDAFRGDIG